MSIDRRTFLQAALGLAASGCLAPSRAGRRVGLVGRPPVVAGAKAADFATYREALQAVIARAGGLGFIHPGQTVMLKPATNSGNAYPATTDPETIAVVARLVQEQGGIPFVADRSMVGRDTRQSFRSTGIADAARDAGIATRHLEDDPSVALHHPSARHWARHTIPIARSAVEADHLISLCSPRTHILGDFTMSLKNNVGVVDGLARVPMHTPLGLKERLAEISLVVRPSFIVLDGRRAFVSLGPDSGDLAHPGVLLAGRDPVAIDAVGLALLRKVGVSGAVGEGSIWELPQLARAVELGVGVRAAGEVELLGLDSALATALRREMA